MSKLMWLLLFLVCLTIALLVGANIWVVNSSRAYVFEDMERLPYNDIGLVLGTSPFTRQGNSNLLFRHRIKAAAALYHAGKLRHLLLSGANPDETYNEPRKMYQALRKAGVPDEAMTLDFAGFRTFDSVVRAKRIFGLEQLTIISQRFHDYRAVFIARHVGLDAVAYNRPQEDPSQNLRTEVREFFARVVAVVDLFVIPTRPRHLGKRVEIRLEPSDNETQDLPE